MLCDYPEAKSVVKRDVFGSGFGLASPYGYKKALAFLKDNPDKASDAGVTYEQVDKAIKDAQGLLKKVGAVIPGYEHDIAVHRVKKPKATATADIPEKTFAVPPRQDPQPPPQDRDDGGPLSRPRAGVKRSRSEPSYDPFQ